MTRLKKQKLSEEKNPEIRLNLFPTVNLPNAIEGDRDFGRRINLEKLNASLKDCPIFVGCFDRRKNPYQNYIEVTINNLGFFSGKFWIYSNGTTKTNMPMADKFKLMVLDLFYRGYIRGCFND